MRLPPAGSSPPVPFSCRETARRPHSASPPWMPSSPPAPRRIPKPRPSSPWCAISRNGPPPRLSSPAPAKPVSTCYPPPTSCSPPRGRRRATRPAPGPSMRRAATGPSISMSPILPRRRGRRRWRRRRREPEVAQRLVRIGGGLDRRHRVLPDLVLKVGDGGVELGVAAQEGGVGEVVHRHVGIDAVPFDQPGSVRAEDAELGGGGDPLVHQEVGGGQPDLPTPGAGADHLAQPQALDALGEGLAIRAGVLVDQHHQVAAEGVLHVRRGRAHPRLPPEPRLALELVEQPALNV